MFCLLDVMLMKPIMGELKLVELDATKGLGEEVTDPLIQLMKLKCQSSPSLQIVRWKIMKWSLCQCAGSGRDALGS